MYRYSSRVWYVENDNDVSIVHSVTKPEGDLVVNITDADFLVYRLSLGYLNTYQNTTTGKNLILFENGVSKGQTEWYVESLLFDGAHEVLWCSFDSSFLEKRKQKLNDTTKAKESSQTNKKWYEFWKQG